MISMMHFYSVFRYEDQQKSIVSEMVSISCGYSEPLASLGASLSRYEDNVMIMMMTILSRLDALVSLAMAAVSAPTQFTRPRVRQTEEGHSAQVRAHQFVGNTYNFPSF